MILGITGGIASGKSTVTEMFRKLGAEVVSADQLSREAVQPGSAALERLVSRFGEKILDPDGRLDRSRLASIVFADPEERAALNRITHPAIAALAEQRFSELAEEKADLIVYEAPLLFEAGAENRVDAILVVKVEEKEQLRRLQERDGLDAAGASARIAAQMPQAEKIARADFVIDNSGSLEQTEARVREIYRELALRCRENAPSPAEKQE